jgi:hypothetical protein
MTQPQQRMSETEAALHAVVGAARERPGQLVTAYSAADRSALEALAAAKAREAADLAAQAGAGGTTGGRP